MRVPSEAVSNRNSFGPERRYERLRPKELKEIRSHTPAAFIPLGTLEWHGFHAPVGLDGLKASALALRCAQAGGGLVFPTLYYGENREGELIELFEEYRLDISRGMGLREDAFKPGYMVRSVQEQVQAYHNLLFHILCEVTSLGFKLVVFVAGHYPLLEHSTFTSKVFFQHASRHFETGEIPVSWSFADYDLVEDIYPGIADHAGFWETSLLMALEPGLVDLSTLPEDETSLVGVLGGAHPVREANAEFGEKAVQAIVERAVRGVRDRLDNPEKYFQR